MRFRIRAGAKSFGLLAVAMLAGCESQAVVVREHSLTPVIVQAVETPASQSSARYAGIVGPNSRVDLAFRVSGYVDDILQVTGANGRSRDVQDGDSVTKGTALARIRESDYTARVEQARSAEAQGLAALDQSKFQLQEAEAALAQAKLEFSRASILFEKESLTKPDFDSAKTRTEVAQARVDGAKTQITAAEARIQGAQAQIREAQVALADCTLRAPSDGVVVRRGIERGMLTTSGTPAFSLADTSSVKVTFGAPDMLLPLLKLGAAVPITAEAIPGMQFAGTVTRIAPAGDPKTRVFDADITVPNPRNVLKMGMIVSLAMPGAAPARPTPAVALTSIFRSKNNPESYAVFVVEDSGGKKTAHLREVTLGDLIGNLIAVKSGLSRGELVIINGSSLVRDGEQVQIVQ